MLRVRGGVCSYCCVNSAIHFFALAVFGQQVVVLNPSVPRNVCTDSQPPIPLRIGLQRSVLGAEAVVFLAQAYGSHCVFVGGSVGSVEFGAETVTLGEQGASHFT